MSTTDTSGWVKLHRSILQWEWWDEPNTARLFIYCLLKANPTDKQWHGQTIERGSFLTSLASIVKETKLTTQQVRTSLDRLKSTNEITKQSTNGVTKIIITNYDNYQDTQQAKQQGFQQTSNKQITNGTRKNQQTNNKAANKQITNGTRKNTGGCEELQQTNNKQNNIEITNEQQAEVLKNNNNEEYKKKENNYLSPSYSASARNLKCDLENLEGENNNDETAAPAATQAPTPEPYYGSTYTDTESLYTAYRAELTADTMASESACRLAYGWGKAITKEQLGEYLDRFQDNRRASGDTHTTHSDYRRHFTNWLRITIQNETRTPSNNHQYTSNNGRNQQQNERPHHIADASQFVDRL